MPDADWKLYKRMRGQDLPPTLELARGAYVLEQLFKNDFYAATGAYRASDPAASPTQVLYKVYHTDKWGPFDLDWLGRALCEREVRYHQVLDDVAGVPRLLERHGETGMVREYVAGRNLMDFRGGWRPSGPRQSAYEHSPDSEFFPRLESILATVHARGIAHNDLAKPENILVGDDGKPYLIDFQIAMLPADWPLGLGRLVGGWLRYQQWVDRFHIRKHYARARPEDLTDAELAESDNKGLLLNLHFHCIRQPYRAVRHFFLRNWLLKPECKG